MEVIASIDTSAASRDIIRALRTGLRDRGHDVLPESVAWHLFIELRRRGEPTAGDLFVQALKSLHTRRSIAGSQLPNDDNLPDEHRLIEDVYLGDLWKAYKKCIRMQRTGPASQLLRDIEDIVTR